MTNAELIKVLRCEMYGDDECDKSSCPIWSELGCRNGIANRAAADALEAAEKRIAELEEEHNKTVTAIFGEEQLWWENRCKDLEAQLPKEGEWIDANGASVPLDKDGYATNSCYCSVCGDWLTGSDEYATRGLYCPNCGARMDGAIHRMDATL